MNKKYRPVSMVVGLIILQLACAVQLIWGAYGNAWAISWLSSYIGVIAFVEIIMYNDVVNKGHHPIKSLYGIFIMNGFAFFATVGFTVEGGWTYSWIGLVAAAIAVVVTIPIAKSVSKGYEGAPEEKKDKKGNEE